MTRIQRLSARLSPPEGRDAGLVLAVGAALVSGLAIYLNAFAVKQVPDAAVFTTLKNGVAAVALIGLTAATGHVRVRRLDPRQLAGLAAVAIVGGSVPFVLFFTGLAAASAPSAAFIQKTLFVWVAFLAVPFLGETLGIATLAGLGVLIVGQALVLPPTGIAWGAGETLILAATLLWAVETMLVRKLLAELGSLTVACLRMGLGVLILGAYLVVSGKAGVVVALTIGQWGWVALTGVILAAYVATWFGALKRAPASVVTSVLVLGIVVTGALSAATNGRTPSPSVVAGYLLILAAATLLIQLTRRAARAIAVPAVGPEPVRVRGD